MPSHPPSETQEFNRDVQFLLKPNNPHARSLLAFITRTIHQFGLQVYITEIDIFVEAYLRGVKYTQQNQEPIRQPKAWMRRTAYNIIRECKRDRLRYSAVAFDELMEQPSEESAGTALEAIDDGAIANSINAVMQALDALSPGDRNLIQWKVVEGLTWQQVQARCVTEGEERVSQATLRKRGQRALERLRRAYHIFSGEPGAPELDDILSDHPDSEVSERDRAIAAPAVPWLAGGEDSPFRERLSWTITLEGDLTSTSTDRDLIAAIVAELKQHSGDGSLIPIRVESGSIVIELYGTAEGYSVIEALINSGQLTSILGLPVKSVNLVSQPPQALPPAAVPQDCGETSPPGPGIEVPPERAALYNLLINLPAAQLRAVVVEVNLPRGNLPPLDASAWEQVDCLFDWAECSVGPGLAFLRTCVANVLNRL
ncbi:RNA polymerase sigma factor [Nodosilinea nodulosa]|uniref:RNA polymerase sigma factor n=1 Tax=Nodosilinea nodulosa TaxID=416001 RepID=UPI0002EE5D05|nr:sigma-70 family RNA polymerase sigma factor [Nodosilinea nodulosa]